MHARPRSFHDARRWVRRIGTAVALAVVAGSAHAATVRVVTQASVAWPHDTSIQAAVDAAAPGDWVLIDAGTYHEAVRVTTRRIHIRGIDRNAVVIDGQHRVGNGIEVWKADDVSIENLTVRDFDRPSRNGRAGNEIWWNGGDGSGQIGLHGWRGRYLTAYATGLNAGYGIFISNAVSGGLDRVYASGFNDSGLYLGACRDCRARIAHALVENNALGYSGTNSGGHVLIEQSIFQHNSNGIGPNSLNNDDQPPPQDGACSAGRNRSPLPTFPTTHISRCTIFRNNVVRENDNFSAPANSTTASTPWGNGFILVGTYADLIEDNLVQGNPSTGLLGFENPDPFPPTPDTVFFQLAGNMIRRNRFLQNGTPADAPYSADVTLAGGLLGQQLSVNDCLADNVLVSTYPADLATGWSCRLRTTPNPGAGALGYILQLRAASLARTSVPQPAPGPQPTMPDPCAGVPANPLCV